MSKGGYFTLAEAARLAGISAKELAAVGTKLRDQVGTKSRPRAPKAKRSKPAPAHETDVFTGIVRSELGLECVKELKFCPDRRWRFDYAIPAYKIALEVEGGTYKRREYIAADGMIVTTTGGRHNSSRGFLGDMEKYNTATVLGWRILRTIPDKLLSGETLDMIRDVISNNYGKS